jgi:hypothetical protein
MSVIVICNLIYLFLIEVIELMKRLDEADAEARRREAREILVKTTAICLCCQLFPC